DLDEARARLRQAFPGGEPIRLTLKTSTDRFRRSVALALKAQLAEVGIDVVVQSLEWGTLMGDLKRGNFQLATLKWTPVIDPDILRLAYHSGSIPTAESGWGVETAAGTATPSWTRSSWRRGRGATSRSVARSTSARSTSWPTTCPPFPSCTRNPSGWSRAACEGSASTRRVACAASRRPGGCSEPGAAQDRAHPARRGRSAAPRLGLPRPRPRRSGGRDPRRASDGGRPGGAPQGAAPRPQRLGPDGVFRARRARPGSPQLGSPVSGPSLRPHRAGLSSHGPPRADLAGLRADDRPSARSRRRAPPPHRRRHARQRLCRAGSGAAAHLDRSALRSRLRHPPGLVARFGIRVGQEPGAAHGDAGAGAGRIPRPHDPRLASRHAG